MKRSKIVFVIALLFLFSCAGEPGKDGSDGTSGENGTNGTDGSNGSDGTDGIDGQDGLNGVDGSDGTDGQDGTDGSNGQNGEDSTNDIAIVHNLSGKLQKGPCFKDGEVMIQALDPLTMKQSGVGPFIGFTDDYYGHYDVPAEMAALYAEVFFEGECHNEITGGSGTQRLSGIIKVTDPVNNINPLTKIRSIVAREIFTNNIDTALLSAEILILSYLGMPALSKRFTEMNLEEAGEHDAVLALVNSMILYDRSEAEQGDYIVSIANGVIGDDQDLKAEIADTIAILPIIQIKNNLETRYAELGMDINVPPLWRLGFPDYYVDLLERDSIEQGSFNLDDSAGCSFDMSTYNMFAIPHVFESWIETSRYLALNLAGGDISIWTRIFNGYDRPGAKLIEIEELREILLDGNMVYNGMLGDHSLSSGTDYYIVISNDTGWALSTGCDGGLLPFGRKLASQDGGLNWIGHDNITPWFRKSGLKIRGWD